MGCYRIERSFGLRSTSSIVLDAGVTHLLYGYSRCGHTQHGRPHRCSASIQSRCSATSGKELFPPLLLERLVEANSESGPTVT